MSPARNILILALLLAGVAIAQTTQPSAPARKAVGMKGMTFSPATITIKVGDTIVWNNDDDRDHTVVASGNAFKSDNIRPGGSYSFTFTKAGTYTYTCSYHPRMRATIVVTDK
jgi:plastocyanin